MSQLAYNKACEIEDFTDSDLVTIIRTLFQHEARAYDETFPAGAEMPRYWAAAMGVRALRDHGALTPDALVLVVGAGLDPTLFYLTGQAQLVFAVDHYLTDSAWNAVTPRLLLLEPEELAPYPFDPQRLVVQHMDGRRLRFPDAMFDGILAFDLVEHTGSLDAAANAAYELGRVLKPGGVLAVSTSYRLNGPPGGVGYNDTALPTLNELQHYIVAASGLDPVDTLNTNVSEDTLASRRDLAHYAEVAASDMLSPELSMHNGFAWSHQPYVVHIHQGYVFSSVSLALQKTPSYNTQVQDWARPDEATQQAIQRHNQALLTPPSNGVGHQRIATTATERIAMQRSSESIEQMRSLYRTWDEARIRGWYNQKLRRLPKPLAALGRTFIRVGNLGKVHDAQAQLSSALVDQQVHTEMRLDEAGTRIGELEVRSDDHSEQIASVHDKTRQQQQALSSLASINGRIASFEQQIAERDAQQQTLLAGQAQLTQQLAALEQLLTSLNAAQEQQTQQMAHIVSTHQHTAQRLDELASIQEQAAQATRDQVEQQAAQRTTLEQRVREAVGATRLLQQQLAMQHTPITATGALSAAEAGELIVLLERELPELAVAQAVEVSVQGTDAEEALGALAAHFGNRSSSRTSPYRYPNDVWYHIDLTADWQRPNLFAGAVARLAREGRFVLATTEGHTLSADTSGLELVENRLVTLQGGKTLRVFVWRKI